MKTYCDVIYKIAEELKHNIISSHRKGNMVFLLFVLLQK